MSAPQRSLQSSLPRTEGRRFNSDRLHRLFGASQVVRAMSIGMLARLEMSLMGGHKQPDVMASIKASRSGAESLLSGNEAFMLFSLARAQSGLAGEMAEVGVYQGCSAKIISTASGGRPLHLFDTFAGLPKPDADEHARMRQGHYAASLPAVQAFLSDRPGISYYPGVFSTESAQAVADRKFSLVHLDVDLRAGTASCLDFFYPRMVPGGIIVTHDYSYLDGVRDAFTEFLDDKVENVIELPSSQAMIVKLQAPLTFTPH